MITVKCKNCGNTIQVDEAVLDEGVNSYLCNRCDHIIKIRIKRKMVSTDRREITRKKILVAEDARSVCTLVSDLLSNAGFDVVTAYDGEEALEVLNAEHPDLLLLDLRMPKKSGFDVLRDMKKGKDSRDIPVLAMSAVYRDPSNIRILRELGASGFINKDNLADTLIDRVKHCLH